MLRVATYLLVAGACLGCLGHLSRDIERAIAVFGSGVLLASIVTSVSARRASVLREIAPWALAGAIVAIGALLVRLFPIAWHLQMATADLYCRAAAWIAREPRHLGPTAMALPVLGAALSLVAARAILGTGPAGRAAWRMAAVLCAAQLVYLIALTPVAAWFSRHRPAWQDLLLNSQWLAVATLALAFSAGNAWWRWRGGGGAAKAATPRTQPRIRRGIVRDPRVLAAFALALAVGLGAGRAPAPAPAAARVLLYDAGYTNWKVPQHGEYGEKSGGMFGLLPFLLQAAGHDVTVTKDLSALAGPNAPQVVALINIQEFLVPADKTRLLDFVRRGGGLLCMGDHTGVAGIRGPFNDLLAPTGIEFIFDSATFFHEGWSTGAELRHHAMNRGVPNGENYQIWVGASLEIAPSVTPVVVGRYGYSDMGDMSNLRMAYLGDRRYNPDEQLGDIVLVAEARLGDGKILVFGDTSTYQNLALARSSDVVLRSFDHLARPGGGGPSARTQWLLLLALVAGLGLASQAGRRALPLVAAAAGLGIASIVTGLGRAPHHALDWSRVRAPSLQTATTGTVPRGLAIVDRSHGGRFDLRAWFDPSVGGLLLNLVRDGFFPVVADRFPEQALERASLFVTIAPMRAYSSNERAVLRRFVERGGRVIACAGWEDYDGARSLLTEYGFDVLDIPLSHFRTGDRPEDLVFRNAWVVQPPADGRVLVSQWGQPVIASRNVGRGEFVVIGDSGWYWNRNFEGREQWFIGNIRFASALAHGHVTTAVEGRFRDPRDLVAELADTPGVTAPGATVPAQPAPLPPQPHVPIQAQPHQHGQQQQPHVHTPAPHAHPPAGGRTP